MNTPATTIPAPRLTDYRTGEDIRTATDYVSARVRALTGTERDLYLAGYTAGQEGPLNQEDHGQALISDLYAEGVRDSRAPFAPRLNAGGGFVAQYGTLSPSPYMPR